jgi:hypothetical protein
VPATEARRPGAAAVAVAGRARHGPAAVTQVNRAGGERDGAAAVAATEVRGAGSPAAVVGGARHDGAAAVAANPARGTGSPAATGGERKARLR